MALPPFAEIRLVRVERAMGWLGLHWLTTPAPSFEMIGDWFEIEGRATWDDKSVFDIKDRIDTRVSPDPIRYEYGLSFIDAHGDHQRREIHFHYPGRRKPIDVCHNACHRHSYVGVTGGSERPKLPPCTCATLEDALEELVQLYFNHFPSGGVVPVR